MADTLVILPTIWTNVALASAALFSLAEHHTGDMPDVALVLDGTSWDQRSYLAGIVERAGGMAWVDSSETRRGLVAAYRAGFAAFGVKAHYRYLILLEEGVRVTPGWDATMRRTLEAHPRYGWVACGQVENPRAPFTSMCSMMTRECALSTEGGPDLAFAPCQFDDGDMFMRVVKAGFTPQAVAHQVHHPVSRTSREGTAEDDWALIQAHRVTFQQRWGLNDFLWANVPIHRPCEACR